MNLDRHEIADEYIVTAERIFEFCGADTSSTLRVDELMDKFAPFIKTNKAEYSYLRCLLDPHQNNPDITVSELAVTLSKYSESQKTKVDLDESFNAKSGSVPHDSDSGISSDDSIYRVQGFQLLEELQCELREKAQLLQQLRRQLGDCEALHEDALAAAADQRNALQEQLNTLREENASLNHIRRDYEEACERLCVGERTLDEARAQLEGARRRARDLADRVEQLEAEKRSLTEQLSGSKAECHRINEMYASRQSALLLGHETLRQERAELQASAEREQRQLQRQLQRLHAEKVLLEMELKEVLSRSEAQLRAERSIDVSYTDDQILSALDSLNADSRFTQESLSVCTQTEPCVECDRRAPHRGLRRYLWDSLKWLFQVFAVVCFACAVCVLWGVSGRTRPCPPLCPPTAASSWWWMQAHELLDLLLTIEYVSEVPM